MASIVFNFLFILSVIIGLVFFEAPVNVDLLQSSEKAFQSWKHPLGCDRLGRDIYALYAFGTFTTFLISVFFERERKKNLLIMRKEKNT